MLSQDATSNFLCFQNSKKLLTEKFKRIFSIHRKNYKKLFERAGSVTTPIRTASF